MAPKVPQREEWIVDIGACLKLVHNGKVIITKLLRDPSVLTCMESTATQCLDSTYTPIPSIYTLKKHIYIYIIIYLHLLGEETSTSWC